MEQQAVDGDNDVEQQAVDGDNDVEQQAVDDNQDPDYVPSEESGDQAEVRGGDLARKVYCGRRTRRGATKKHMQGVSVKKNS